MKYDVFISYRRDGADTLSQLLYDRLIHRGYRVFLDIESLNSGKFNEKLLEVIEECKDIIVVLPPNGLDRCNNEGDWVYRELEHAMKLKKNIIPVLMKNFEWPDKLPEAIAEIKNYNGIVDNKDYFDAVVEKLTTLMISKPVVGGNFLKKANKKKQTFADKVKRQKKIIAGVIILLLCGAGVFAFMKHNQKQKVLMEQETATIRLVPDDEMGASEYYDAIEILKERFEILVGDKEHSFEENKDELLVNLPMEVFNELELDLALKCYLTRPAEIYISSEEATNADDNLSEDEYFHIERSDVESVEIVQKLPENIDLEQYKLHGIESSEECQMFAIKIKNDAAEDLKEWMQEKGWNKFNLYQDMEEFNYYETVYYWIEDFTEDNIIYIMDNYQYENILNLVQYNYTNETFSKPFTFSYKLPVKWEYDTDEGVVPGENQTNIDDLSGELARFEYVTYDEEITDGEFQDIIKAFKNRLDALGIPYAFGYNANDGHQIVIETNPIYFNNFVCEYIGRSYKMEIVSNFYDILTGYNIESTEVIEAEDGSYSIEITPSESWFTTSRESTVDQMTGDMKVYLGVADFPTFIIDESTLEDAFDGEKFVFDSLSVFGVDKIDEIQKHIFDESKALNETEMPVFYSVKNIFLENREPVDLLLSEEDLLEEVKEKYEAVLDEIELIESYKVNVRNTGQSIGITAVCSDKEDYVESAHKIFEQLYNKTDLKSGDTEYAYITFKENEEDTWSVSFYVSADRYNHGIGFSASYYLDENDNRGEAFDALFNENDFYGQFHINDYNIKNGKISFQ